MPTPRPTSSRPTRVSSGTAFTASKSSTRSWARGCRRVQCSSNPDGELAVGVWKDGRLGSMRGIRKGPHPYGASVLTGKGIQCCPAKMDFYPGLCKAIVKFFQTGQVPVSLDETLEICAFIDAAYRSSKLGGDDVGGSICPRPDRSAGPGWRLRGSAGIIPGSDAYPDDSRAMCRPTLPARAGSGLGCAGHGSPCPWCPPGDWRAGTGPCRRPRRWPGRSRAVIPPAGYRPRPGPLRVPPRTFQWAGWPLAPGMAVIILAWWLHIMHVGGSADF